MGLLKAWYECRMIFLFLSIYAIFHFAYFQVPDDVLREVVYYQGFGVVCVQFIHFFAPLEPVSALHNHLQSPRADLEIVRGCDGAGALFLLLAAILAFPASIKRKVIGLVLGALLMYCLNLVRLIGLYFLVAYHNGWFLLVHTYLAPTLLVVLACLFFAWWAFGSTSIQ